MQNKQKNAKRANIEDLYGYIPPQCYIRGKCEDTHTIRYCDRTELHYI